MAARTGGSPESAGGAGRKDRVVHVRLSAAECSAIDAAAAASGVSISGFMRSLSLEGAGVVPFLTDEDRAVFAILAADMRSLGVNLNQIARKANATGRVEAKEIHLVLVDVQRLVAALAIELRAFGRRAAHRRRVP